MNWSEKDEKHFTASMRALYPGVPETAWGTYRATAMSLKDYQRLDVDSIIEREIREDTVRRLLSIGGPLYQYLHPEGDGATFSRFKELINEVLGTNLNYADLYSGQFAGWLFNGSLEWSEADRQQADDLDSLISKSDDIDD